MSSRLIVCKLGRMGELRKIFDRTNINNLNQSGANNNANAGDGGGDGGKSGGGGGGGQGRRTSVAAASAATAAGFLTTESRKRRGQDNVPGGTTSNAGGERSLLLRLLSALDDTDNAFGVQAGDKECARVDEDAAFAAPAPASSSAVAWRPSQIVPVGVAAAAKVASETQIVNSAGGVFLNDSVRDAIVDMGVGDTPSILVVLGSTRDGRQGEKVAKMAAKHLKAAGLEPTLIDPLSVDAPLLRQPIHFFPEAEQANAPEWMKTLHEQIKNADGIVLVSAEYNATLPPALTNLLDHFPPASYRHKPCSLVTYSMGNFGGCRAHVALLPFVNELGMVCLPSALRLPLVDKTDLDAEGNTKDEEILKHVTKLCQEMKWYAEAMSKQKESSSGYPN